MPPTMKSADELYPIAVIGAGTMGQGIAQLAAQSGYPTRLYDADRAQLERALSKARDGIALMLSKGRISAEEAAGASARLSASPSLSAAAQDAGLVIEAIPEQLALKIELLRELAALTSPQAILASNTSSLSLTEIAAGSGSAARVVGMHFFNPPPVMKLLELVKAEQTSPEALAAARAVGVRMGKEVIEVRDSPGFASSRLGIVFALEAIRMLEEGVASAADIDRAMELGYNHPMGPLKLTDLVGLDVRLAIAEHLSRELGGFRFQPPQLLKRLVRAGKLGRKSGEGFYKYDSRSA
jgi:3-hydroxybutyryl-CoA dehydrogenase